MAAARKFFVNLVTGKRQFSATDGADDSATTLSFYKSSTVPVELTIVEPDTSKGVGKYRVVDITDLALTITIASALNSATPEVEATTWTKDVATGRFIGAINLNTAAMNTYISADTKTGYLQVKISDSGGAYFPILREQVNLKYAVDTTATTPPDQADRYLKWSEAVGYFMARRLGPGETVTLVSPDGNHERVLGVNDNGTAQDDIV